MTKVADGGAEAAEPAAAEMAGGPEGFRLLVERYGARLFRLAYRMTRQEQDAEDLVQETFLRAYRGFERFEARANVATWLYRICVNASLDQLRKRRGQAPMQHLDDPDGALGTDDLPHACASPERLLLSAEMRRAIEAAMEELSPVERAAFALRHYERLSIAEIGAVLGLREAATKNTIFRGVRKLRRALGPLTTAGWGQ